MKISNKLAILIVLYLSIINVNGQCAIKNNEYELRLKNETIDSFNKLHLHIGNFKTDSLFFHINYYDNDSLIYMPFDEFTFTYHGVTAISFYTIKAKSDSNYIFINKRKYKDIKKYKVCFYVKKNTLYFPLDPIVLECHCEN